MQLLSELIDKLNEVLTTENASVDRIISRMDQTPIQDVKQKLKQHLKETNIQKSRLRKIIIRLGGKPTDLKTDYYDHSYLSRCRTEIIFQGK